MEPGELTRISVNDPRDIPTIKMNYGLEVPLPKASAGMRRIVAIAYMLVWTWREHYQASNFLSRPTVESVTFLVDEIEAHLHPKWQRLIVRALLNVNSMVSIWPDVQLIISTHSPMVMASLEQFFDKEKDSWFDLDYVESEQASREQIVAISKRPFLKQGDASNWLVSEAFDLEYAMSSEAESILKKAGKLLTSENDIDKDTFMEINNDLHEVLSTTDPFWIRWRYIAEKRGWLN